MLYYDSDALQKNIQAELIENATKEASTKGLAKGLKKGLEKGKSQSQRETALNMLKDNTPDDLIIKYTGIAVSKLNELKNQI
jgi:flagellar biosynthesis/type III secretory pathway protein FliH